MVHPLSRRLIFQLLIICGDRAEIVYQFYDIFVNTGLAKRRKINLQTFHTQSCLSGISFYTCGTALGLSLLSLPILPLYIYICILLEHATNTILGISVQTTGVLV